MLVLNFNWIKSHHLIAIFQLKKSIFRLLFHYFSGHFLFFSLTSRNYFFLLLSKINSHSCYQTCPILFVEVSWDGILLQSSPPPYQGTSASKPSVAPHIPWIPRESSHRANRHRRSSFSSPSGTYLMPPVIKLMNSDTLSWTVSFAFTGSAFSWFCLRSRLGETCLALFSTHYLNLPFFGVYRTDEFEEKQNFQVFY